MPSVIQLYAHMCHRLKNLSRETNFQEKQLTEYGGETVHTLGKLDRVIAMGQKRTLLM